MPHLFTIIETKKESQKWETLIDNNFFPSTICERYNLSKDYKTIKIRPFECSECSMIDLFSEENFPSKINQYKSSDVLTENNYLHFFIYYNDLSRLKYIPFEDVLNFDYKKTINPNVYKLKKKWQYNKCTICIASYKENTNNENLTYENYLGKRFFEELKNLKKVANPKDIRICFFIDDIIK